MTNIEFSKTIITKLSEWGVKTMALCPGGRNAPFVSLLEKSKGFEILSFYDERSASFFALGRAQRDQRPVAVLTTSGTAVSELLSSAIEAHYTQTPLIFLTADRPKRLRKTGAPQAIEQKNIFGTYVENCFDLETQDVAELTWKQEGPLHLNICFDEPLIDAEVESFDFSSPEKWNFPTESPSINGKVQDWLANKNRPLLVVGGLCDKSSWSLEKTLVSWSGGLYLESLSGLRESPLLQERSIVSDRQVQHLLSQGVFDSVLRLGDVPVAKFWRTLDGLVIPILFINDKNFRGLEKSEIVVGELDSLQSLTTGFEFQNDSEASKTLDLLLKEFPQSEPSFFKKLSEFVPEAATLYLGNSLPIRQWDLFALRDKRFHTQANRGANGIDGQVSTGLGRAVKGKEHWLILGDLTSLYDFSGLWVTEQLKQSDYNVRLVVINNSGGQIFSRIFNNELFLNQHRLNFKAFAEMWGWEYHLVKGDTLPNQRLARFSLIEVQPDHQQTQSFWKRYDQTWTL